MPLPRWEKNSIALIFILDHQVRGKFEQIGRLQVTASLEGIYDRLRQRIIILLASNAVTTFVVSGFILLLFQKSLTQHLIPLSRYVQDHDLKNGSLTLFRLDRPASSHPDELGQVVSAFNDLCASGRRAWMSRDAARSSIGPGWSIFLASIYTIS